MFKIEEILQITKNEMNKRDKSVQKEPRKRPIQTVLDNKEKKCLITILMAQIQIVW